jgi:hypothetical protein
MHWCHNLGKVSKGSHMNADEVVRDMLVALDNGDIENVAGYLGNNLVFSAGGVQAGKNEFIKMLGSIGSIRPSIEWFFIKLHTEGDQVRLTLEPAGQHTGTLLKPDMTLPTPSEMGTNSESSDWMFTVSSGKVSSIRIDAVPGSLLADILKQLGLV